MKEAYIISESQISPGSYPGHETPCKAELMKCKIVDLMINRVAILLE